MDELTIPPAGALAFPLLPGALTLASDDAHLIALWLRRPNLSPRTVRAAAMEAHRFMLWCASHQLQLRTVAYEHLLTYAAFIAAPTPAAQWVAPHKYPKMDPRWRPFLGPLSASSQRQALIIIKGLFTWARAAGYLQHNPATLLGALPRDTPDTVDRFLPEPAIPLLLRAVERMPDATALQQRRQERARFVVLAYYYSAARLSELVQADMHSFQRGHDGRWWLHVLGKGSRRGKIPVPNVFLQAYMDYRIGLGLDDLPYPDESLPLIMTSLGAQRRASAHTAARIVKAVMNAAAEIADKDGQRDLAQKLKLASTHWLRHSSLTHQLDNGMPLPTVQRNGRHASIKTTGRYLHKEQAQRHDETTAVWDGIGKLFNLNNL